MDDFPDSLRRVVGIPSLPSRVVFPMTYRYLESELIRTERKPQLIPPVESFSALIAQSPKRPTTPSEVEEEQLPF